MADTKITALTAITTVDPAVDVLPIVDVSDTSMAASGTTKKITSNQILGAGGTATLASATITGDLTVATNTLKTTSGNVGIGTVTPDIFSRFYTRTIGFNSSGSTVMQINGTSYGGIDIGAAGTRTFGLTASGTDVNFGSLTNIPIVFNINSSEAMRLNSTGLGVGESPVSGQKLTVNGNGSVRNGNRLYLWDTGNSTAHGIYNSGDNLTFSKNNGTTSMLLDSVGNLGIGVTPSAWWVGFKAVESSNGVALLAQTNVPYCHLVSNAYDGATNFKYKVNNNYALRYAQDATVGSHIWFNAASSGASGAGTNITFSPVMTLDASGNLILLSSNTPATLTTNGQLTVNATSNTNLRFSYRGSDGVTRVANITLA